MRHVSDNFISLNTDSRIYGICSRQVRGMEGALPLAVGGET